MPDIYRGIPVVSSINACISTHFEFFRCQEDDDEPSPLVQKILDILYATEVSTQRVSLLYKNYQITLICLHFIVNCLRFFFSLGLQDGFAPPDEVPPEEEEY